MKIFKSAAITLLAGIAICGNVSAKPVDDYELQLDYLHQDHASKRRSVDNYNVTLFQKIHEHRALEVYRGLTFTRAVGFTNPPSYGGAHFDSEGVGFGPAMMFRWNQNISGKLDAAWDFSGSFMFYNKAHPAKGRAYGFLWRTGPRLTWNFSDDDAVSLGYYISHFSNGMKTHNPGYNTLGFSLGVKHSF